MNTAPPLGKAAAIAATGPTKAAAAPRIKLSSHGISIDHPDQEHGERLMSEALGVADRDAMYGIPAATGESQRERAEALRGRPRLQTEQQTGRPFYFRLTPKS
jgi:hypothetical protein